MTNISVDGGLKLRAAVITTFQRASHVIGATSGFLRFFHQLACTAFRLSSSFPSIYSRRYLECTCMHGRRLDFFPLYYREKFRAVRGRSRIEIGFSSLVASNYHSVVEASVIERLECTG